MKAKYVSLAIGVMLGAVISGSALAVTHAEAQAQLDRIRDTESRAAAREVLDTLISSGVPVDNGLAVVNDAVSRNVDPNQLRQMGAEIRAQVAQNVSVEQAYARVKSQFAADKTGTASGSNHDESGANGSRAATAQRSESARAGDTMGSVRASSSASAQADQRSSASGSDAKSLTTQGGAVNPVTIMNPGTPGGAAAIANPRVPANFGAAGGGFVGGNPR